MKDGKNNQQKEIVDEQSEASRRRTTAATSQGDLTRPRLKKEDMPQADQKRYNDGVYRGTGTGAGPGGSTDTGGADTSTMEGQARMGTTDRMPNQQSNEERTNTGQRKEKDTRHSK